METNIIFNKPGQIEENVPVCAVDSSESFHTGNSNVDKVKGAEKETAVGGMRSWESRGQQSDFEQYVSAQDQLEDLETSGSIPKHRLQKQDTICMAHPKCTQKDHVCKSLRRKSRDSSLESHRKRQPSSSKNYTFVEPRTSNYKITPVTPDLSSHMNPAYKYSERQDDSWVTSLGQTYIAQHQEQLNNPIPTGTNAPNSQHNPRAGSKTNSYSSRSPVSPRSQNSSKSNTPRHLDSSSTLRNVTNQSPLPVGFSKTSTPYKSQPSNTTQVQSNRTAVPAGTTTSSSKTGTPHKLPSHNTSMQSESVVCRICHDGDGSEVLISPCYCAGSMGLLHVSCLQRWLGSSNKTSCEICSFEFALQKKTMPISKFLKEPGTTQDKRNLICDMACFLTVTPLTTVVTWLCIHGAVRYYENSQLEKGGLIGLAISLILLYAIWTSVAIRHNWRLWKDWKMFHQDVTLVCTPASTKKCEDLTTGSVDSRSTLGSIHLQSIRINVQGPMTRYSGGRRNERRRRKREKREKKQGTADHTNQFSGHLNDSQDKMQSRLTRSVSQNIQNNTESHEAQNFHGKGQSNRCRVESHDIRNYYVNEENQYYNTEARREVNDQNKKNFLQLDNKSNQYCKGSLVSSCTFSADNQRHRNLKPKVTKPEQFDEFNPQAIHCIVDGQRTKVNAVNMLPSHRSSGYATANNHYINSPQDRFNTGQSQQQSCVGPNEPIHSRNSPEETTSRDSFQDFVTKWVDDQREVLDRQNQQLNGQYSDSRGTSVHGKETVPSPGIDSRRATLPGVNRRCDVVKNPRFDDQLHYH